jgi:hypothetical protein
MQSHGGQVRKVRGSGPSAGSATDAIGSARFARRRLLKAAIFGLPGADEDDLTSRSAYPMNSSATHAVIGTVLDVSPHILVLQTAAGEERLTLAASTTAWRGGPVAPAALRQGDRAIVKRNYVRNTVADRIWAEIGRVTGTIVDRDAGTLLVDEGTEQGRKILVIPEQASGRIQVRFPRLQPGYLVDVIGLRRPGFVEGLIPATSQPPYRADQPPSPPLVSGNIPGTISGTATWHEPGEEPEDLLGVAYPALDPETGCEGHSLPPARDETGPAAAPAAETGRGHTGRHARASLMRAGTGQPGTRQPAAASGHGHYAGEAHHADQFAVDPHQAGPGCVQLPYLSIGSLLPIRNDCAQRSRELPVTSCGAAARLFCDRCVTCGTSPRGRVADLTMSAFVDLGGDLDRGCFNATIMIGG